MCVSAMPGSPVEAPFGISIPMLGPYALGSDSALLAGALKVETFRRFVVIVTKIIRALRQTFVLQFYSTS